MTEFHIHIDAQSLSPEFEKHLLELNFARTDFAGHPDGVEGFEPPNHLTRKLYAGRDFQELFETVLQVARKTSGLIGYVEAEFIAADQRITHRMFDPAVHPPFRLSLSPLPHGSFRESEIHITMSRDDSHPQLLHSLREMGLFSAYLPKPYGIAQVFTVQGSRADIARLFPALERFLTEAGGAAECSIKEERVLGWWLSSPEISLPPVVGSIHWS